MRLTPGAETTSSRTKPPRRGAWGRLVCRHSQTRTKQRLPGLLALLLLAASPAAAAAGPQKADPAREWQSQTSARIDFETATAALAAGDRHLAAGLLRDLRDGSAGLERRSYEALLLAAGGRAAAARAELEAIVAQPAAGSLPAWLLSDLVDRLARDRLSDLRTEAGHELEAVLTRHYEARGGLEQQLALTDMIAHGTMRVGDVQLPLRLVRKRPSFYRLDLATPSGRQIEATDGRAAWRLRPPYRPEDGVLLSGEALRGMLDVAPFDDVLLRYRETGERLHLAGTELVGGREAHRIEVDAPSGGRLTVFLDRDTALETRRLIWGEPGAPPVAITIEQGDFDGRALPARQIVESADGVVEYVLDGYDFDGAIDPAAFELESVRQREAARLARVSGHEQQP